VSKKIYGIPVATPFNPDKIVPKGIVKTVNDVAPDESGNVVIDVSGEVNDALTAAKEKGEFNGNDGAPGKSAYQYAQEGGFTGTEADFAELLAGLGASGGEAGEIFSAYLTDYNPVGSWDALEELYFFNLPEEITEGKTYIVTLDGTAYTATATLGDDGNVRVSTPEFTLCYNKDGVFGYDENTGFCYEWEDKEYYLDGLVWKPVHFSIAEPGAAEPDATGVYTLAEGETIADAPEWAQVVVDPYTDPPAVEMVATFADGTTATYNLYGEAVTA
jgi:hypothetical protein